MLHALAVVMLSLTSPAAPAVSPPVQAPAPPSAEQQVEQTERALIRAITDRDLAVYDRIVADDYVALTVEGTETTKPQAMEMYRSGARRYADLEIYDVRVRVYGDTAVLAARTRGYRLEKDQRVPNLVRYVRVYARRDGRWRAVMQMAATIPAGG